MHRFAHFLRPAAVLGVAFLALATLSTGVLLARPAPTHYVPIVDAATQKRNDPGHRTGDLARGQKVFRFATFGNEGFWTDAARLPRGMMKARFAIRQALREGLMVDIEAVPAPLRGQLKAQFQTDLSRQNAPLLYDPKIALQVLNANGFIGVVAVDSNSDGVTRVEAGDKVGVACAICHTVTDKSVYQEPGGGSVGSRVDGPGNFAINMGAILAMADNSRAFYPNLQAQLGGKTIGRAPKGLTRFSSEAEVDAYLKNPRFYPRGTFDDTDDGIGNSVQNVPFLRTDLAAPWGSSAANAVLDHIANGSYTVNLDLTTIATHSGLRGLTKSNPKSGAELWNNYRFILQQTGVTNYPFVRAHPNGKPGQNLSPSGFQVNEYARLIDMNAYTDSLPAPPGLPVTDAAIRGRKVFEANCVSCHNQNNSRPLKPVVIPIQRMWPAYAPIVIAKRQAPATAVQNAPGIYDDKVVVEDASERGEKRGFTMPLLVDLARKPFFLHDASVKSLDALLDPARGAKSPHPFYLAKPQSRAEVVAFLKTLDTGERRKAQQALRK